MVRKFGCGEIATGFKPAGLPPGFFVPPKTGPASCTTGCGGGVWTGGLGGAIETPGVSQPPTPDPIDPSKGYWACVTKQEQCPKGKIGPGTTGIPPNYYLKKECAFIDPRSGGVIGAGTKKWGSKTECISSEVCISEKCVLPPTTQPGGPASTGPAGAGGPSTGVPKEYACVQTMEPQCGTGLLDFIFPREEKCECRRCPCTWKAGKGWTCKPPVGTGKPCTGTTSVTGCQKDSECGGSCKGKPCPPSTRYKCVTAMRVPCWGLGEPATEKYKLLQQCKQCGTLERFVNPNCIYTTNQCAQPSISSTGELQPHCPDIECPQE